MTLEREAHVWLVRADAAAPRRLDWLDRDEHRRHRRYLRAADRDLFLVSHTHLRATLSRYAEVPPPAWRFVRRAHGRPELDRPADCPPLRFSLSHTPGLVACMVTATAACGVDVEREGRVQQPEALAERFFAPAEQASVAAHPSRFLAHWTLKEAYVKATGAGLRAPLRRVAFDLAHLPEVRAAFAPGAGWRFTHSRPSPEHHLATAVRGPRSVAVRWA